MSSENWFTLVIACLAMSFSPGTNAMLALTTSVKSGTKKGMRVVAGSLSGFAILTAFAITGAAAFLSRYPNALFAMKLTGAIYLLFLAVKMLRKQHFYVSGGPVRERGFFRQGFVMALSNPKIILFWLAFIPAMMKDSQAGLGLVIVVVATFTLVECLAETLIVFLGKTIQPLLIKYIAWVDAASAFFFAGFAVILLSSLS